MYIFFIWPLSIEGHKKDIKQSLSNSSNVISPGRSLVLFCSQAYLEIPVQQVTKVRTKGAPDLVATPQTLLLGSRSSSWAHQNLCAPLILKVVVGVSLQIFPLLKLCYPLLWHNLGYSGTKESVGIWEGFTPEMKEEFLQGAGRRETEEHVCLLVDAGHMLILSCSCWNGELSPLDMTHVSPVFWYLSPELGPGLVSPHVSSHHLRTEFFLYSDSSGWVFLQLPWLISTWWGLTDRLYTNSSWIRFKYRTMINLHVTSVQENVFPSMWLFPVSKCLHLWCS